jgi:hypothetical protein
MNDSARTALSVDRLNDLSKTRWGSGMYMRGSQPFTRQSPFGDLLPVCLRDKRKAQNAAARIT